MSAAKKHPTSTQLIGMITRAPAEATPKEAHYDQISMTAADYDDAVLSAFRDLAGKPQRFHKSPDDPSSVECPRARLMRIGQESVDAGKSSPLYLYLRELIEAGATLPTVTMRSQQTAQKRLTIVSRFVRSLAELGPSVNFKDAKERFRISEQLKDNAPSQASIDDALTAYSLDWPAYGIDSPRKNRRGKRR